MTDPHANRDDAGRPRWSVSQAAKRAGVARSTIQRYLTQGKMPGAYRTEDGVWSIGVEDLLGAGFRVDAPTPPDPAEVGPSRWQAEAGPSEAARRVAELEAELADARRRAEVAEAVASERADRIRDLQRTVAALEAGRGSAASSVEAMTKHDASPVEPVRSRGIVGRLADRWGL